MVSREMRDRSAGPQEGGRDEHRRRRPRKRRRPRRPGARWAAHAGWKAPPGLVSVRAGPSIGAWQMAQVCGMVLAVGWSMRRARSQPRGAPAIGAAAGSGRRTEPPVTGTPPLPMFVCTTYNHGRARRLAVPPGHARGRAPDPARAARRGGAPVRRARRRGRLGGGDRPRGRRLPQPGDVLLRQQGGAVRRGRLPRDAAGRPRGRVGRPPHPHARAPTSARACAPRSARRPC